MNTRRTASVRLRALACTGLALSSVVGAIVMVRSFREQHAKAIATSSLDGEAEFLALSPDRRDERVCAMQADRRWTPGDRVLFLSLLRRRDLAPLTRNNIANGLLAQSPPIPGLADVFLAMIDDPLESMTWQQYAEQFAALADGASPRVRARLGELLSDGGPRGGTALLQLRRLQVRGGSPPDGAFRAAAAAMAFDDSQIDANRVAALGVLGEIGCADDDRARVRALALQAPIAVRRAALGVIGRSADANDARVLDAALHDEDPSIVACARANRDRPTPRPASAP